MENKSLTFQIVLGVTLILSLLTGMLFLYTPHKVCSMTFLSISLILLTVSRKFIKNSKN